MSQLRAIGRVLRHKLAELDREIMACQSERESAWLWRIRSSVRKVLHALVGHEEK